ncbi:MAG: TIGR00300 family protein [Desulfobacterales bacterium]|nr:TIGR00300 family protein [Desulfobacterales bacterium]
MPEEIVELRGHLIDSLVLPKVLDAIRSHKGCFEIQQMEVGIRPRDPSFARILVAHDDEHELELLLQHIARYGADAVERHEVEWKRAVRNGVFPEGFCSTTNLDTWIYLAGRWRKVKHPEMDSGILLLPDGRSARTIKMFEVRKGDPIVIGRKGVRVSAVESYRPAGEFGFMGSEISMEKPKGLLIRALAKQMKEERRRHRPILWVCGPAVVHSGGSNLFVKLIDEGYVQILFAGNALAAHDIESSMMGTSLGVSIHEGAVTRGGHENHLRAINSIRAAGSIRKAVKTGILRSGIMHACVMHDVDVVLAGSIRDDGPLPEVITDAVAAQAAMRRRCSRGKGVELAVMVATLLHSVATGNMLPARTRVVCVDIQPANVTKLMDRGTFQSVGIVTDVQPFLHELVTELGIR